MIFLYYYDFSSVFKSGADSSKMNNESDYNIIISCLTGEYSLQDL
jgi:hypothetical protein